MPHRGSNSIKVFHLAAYVAAAALTLSCGERGETSGDDPVPAEPGIPVPSGPVVPPGPLGEFTITGPVAKSNIVNPTITFTPSANAKYYKVVVGLNVGCSEVHEEGETTSTSYLMVNPANKYSHFVCVTAFHEDGSTLGASNNSRQFWVRTGSPYYEAPPYIGEFDGVEVLRTFSIDYLSELVLAPDYEFYFGPQYYQGRIIQDVERVEATAELSERGWSILVTPKKPLRHSSYYSIYQKPKSFSDLFGNSVLSERLLSLTTRPGFPAPVKISDLVADEYAAAANDARRGLAVVTLNGVVHSVLRKKDGTWEKPLALEKAGTEKSASPTVALCNDGSAVAAWTRSGKIFIRRFTDLNGWQAVTNFSTSGVVTQVHALAVGSCSGVVVAKVVSGSEGQIVGYSNLVSGSWVPLTSITGLTPDFSFKARTGGAGKLAVLVSEQDGITGKISASIGDASSGLGALSLLRSENNASFKHFAIVDVQTVAYGVSDGTGIRKSSWSEETGWTNDAGTTYVDPPQNVLALASSNVIQALEKVQEGESEYLRIATLDGSRWSRKQPRHQSADLVIKSFAFSSRSSMVAWEEGGLMAWTGLNKKTGKTELWAAFDWDGYPVTRIGTLTKGARILPFNSFPGSPPFFFYTSPGAGTFVVWLE